MSNKQKHLSRDWDPKSGPRFWREMGSSLGRYTPKYFILFVAMVNDIVSLISLSVFSLFVYRNARDKRPISRKL